MKDVLIVTNYYPPEMGAASNRMFQLARGLSQHNFNVSIATPLPNYPKGKIFDGYGGKFKSVINEENISVNRLWIYPSNSKNKFKRFLAMFTYSLSLIAFILFNKIPQIVIIQSPPLLVAFTSLFFIRSKGRKLILNVSDLWPLAGVKLGAINKGFAYRILKRMERYNYSKASLVLGQSKEILSHVYSMCPETRTFLYRNYPDFSSPTIDGFDNSGRLKIVYAGLLGVAQGVLGICQNLHFKNVEFHIYGNGAERELIQNFIKKNPNKSIYYHGELSRKELHKTLVKYHLTIVPLVNRIFGSVPSKIFEYATLGIPMIYFGGGEGEKLVKDYKLGWIAEAGNYESLNAILSSISPETITLEYKNSIKMTVQTSFSFDNQLSQLIKEIN